MKTPYSLAGRQVARGLVLAALLGGGLARAQAPTKLFYTRGSATAANDQLLSANPDGSGAATLASGAANFSQASDLTYDRVNNQVYVVDQFNGAGPILRYNADGTGRTIVVPAPAAGASYQGVALDVTGRKLYFTQGSATATLDALKVVDLNTTSVTTLASGAANFSQPTDIVFDQNNNRLYVVDQFTGSGPILRYNADGTGRTQVVPAIAGASYQSLALDVPGSRLYFTQGSATATLDALKVVNLTTTTVTQLASGSGNFSQPTDLAIDRVNNVLYVADQFNGAGPILRFSTAGTGRTVVVAAPADGSFAGLALNGGLNNPPTQTANGTLTVAQGATGTISSALLAYTDPEEGPASLTYSVTTAATNGTLFRDANLNNTVDAGEALVLTSTFTQADIDANRLRYAHNNSATTSASFGYSITDGQGGTLTGRVFNIIVQDPAAVVSVTRNLPLLVATPTVSYTVTFSTAETGVGTSNFSLATTGLSGASVASVSGSGTAYIVVVNTGTGDGTLRLDVANTSGITPALTNVPFTTGDTYNVVKSFTSPVLTIQGTGGAGGADVTAFVDVVQILLTSTSTVVPTALSNPSFETFNPLGNGNYGYNPTGAAWTFITQSGIAQNGSAFSPPAAPDGSAVAFLQSFGGSNGSAQQGLTLSSGSYQVGFRVAQRNCCSSAFDQNVNVLINGAYVGSILPANNGLYASFLSSPFLVNATTWTGNTSTDWFTASNWDNGVPTATIDAIIPAGRPRYPVFTAGTGTTLGLALQAGGTLTQSGGTLDLKADFSNNGTLLATGGSVTLTGAGSQTVGGSSVSSFWNLAVGTAGAALGGPAAVQRVLTLTGSLNTNANAFTLLSSAGGTTLVVNSGGTVVGNATVQRYIEPSMNSGLGYRHYSSPVNIATFADLTTAGFSPQLNTAYNGSATPGTVTPFPTVFGYDQARLATVTSNYGPFDKGWFSPTATTDAMSVGRGYTVNISASQLVDFVGTLNNGTLALGLNRNTGPTAADAGWNLMGNPFPAPLDYSLVALADRNNLDAAMYVFESTGPYVGTYRSYVNGVGGNPVVPVAQGFFVRVSTGQTSGSLTFRNAQRLTSFDASPFRRGTAETRPLLQLTLRGASANPSDDAYVYFEAGATAGLDPQYDAVKLPNTTGLNLASMAVGTQLAINGLPVGIPTAVTVPLFIGLPVTGTYTLTAAQVLNFAAGVQPFLRDLQLNTLTDLSLSPTYTFTMNAANTTPRFELVFGPQAVLGTASAALAGQVAVFPNPAHKSVWIELPASLTHRAIAAALVDALGRVVLTQVLPAGLATRTLPLATVAAGVYSLRLQTEAGMVVKKLIVE
jgi:hypothetical protein